MTAARYTVAMLRRMLPLPSPAHLITTRAFSSAVPLRFSPYAKNPYQTPYAAPVRTNPLVGDYEPLEESTPASAPEATPSTPANPRRTSDPSPDAQLAAPPPPPPEIAAEAAAEEPKADFTYDAVDTRNRIDIADIISEKSAAYGNLYGVSDPLERPNVRTKAVVGRTVFIKDRLSQQYATSAAVAIRVLDKMCRDQKIKNKYHSQKFHERAGLKKKRLRSERWRARFKKGFKAAVSRVVELKKQGW